MRIMQERHGGRGKRCFFQILQLKRFKRVKRKRAGRLEPVNHLRQKPGSSSLLPATIQGGPETTLAEGDHIFLFHTLRYLQNFLLRNDTFFPGSFIAAPPDGPTALGVSTKHSL